MSNTKGVLHNNEPHINIIPTISPPLITEAQWAGKPAGNAVNVHRAKAMPQVQLSNSFSVLSVKKTKYEIHQYFYW